MKQKIFTFLLILATGLTACKKSQNQPDIREYDEEQIQKYIAANGLTDFIKDTTPDGTGTTGIHYKIITQGTGDTLKYSDSVTLVYTVKSLDGKYISSDTITNHVSTFLGYLAPVANLPKGAQLAIHDILKYKDSNMRLLIPSRLAYGVNGFGTGSSTNTNTRIAGNQSLDYYVHIIGNQSAYDDKVINNFIAAKGFTGYRKDPKGYYYKIDNAGTGAIGAISEFSKVSMTYNGVLLNDFTFESTGATATVLSPYGVIEGLKHALINHATTGSVMSILIPSSLGYGNVVKNSIPASSVLKFDFTVTGIDL